MAGTKIDADAAVKIGFNVDAEAMDKLDANLSFMGELSEKVKNKLTEANAELAGSYQALLKNDKLMSFFVNSQIAKVKATNQMTVTRALKQSIDNYKQAFKQTHPILDKELNFMFGKIKKGFTSLFNGIKQGIMQAFNPSEGIASFDMSSSLFTNREAREMSMRYGLSSGQTYALKNTMGMLNMSEEDLMWMNEAQKEKFNQMMDKYNTFYDEMKASGAMESVQEAQLEIKMLKEDIKNKFLTWFASNKEVIIGALNTGVSILKGIGTVIMKILDAVSFGRFSSGSSALSTEELNNSSTYNNRNINFNNDITMNNNISSEADAKSVNNELSQNVLKGALQAIKTY